MMEQEAQKVKLIYICSPFRSDNKAEQYANVRAAQKYCRDAYNKNCIPVAPHLYLPQFLDDDTPAERDLALRIGLRLINYCSEVWVHGDRISDGMRGEIDYASSTGKKIIYFKTGPQGQITRATETKTSFEGVAALVDYEDMQDLIEEGIVSDLY